MLLAIPLALTSTGYALFSQQLSVTANSSNPAYASSNNMILTYTKVLGSQGQKTTFDMTVTIKNNGTSQVQAWQAGFDLPTDYSQFSCVYTVNCTTSGAHISVANGTTNGTIAAGASITFTFSFSSYSTDWTLQNISVAGSVPATYQTISGLTATNTVSASTKNKKVYERTYVFTVTNTSGSNISAWRIVGPWNNGTTSSVVSMPSTVNYVTDTTQMTILSTASIANGATFQFTAVLGSTSSSWTFSGYSIQGLL